ncbi:MAG: 2TM domain-containing protein [Flavobacterium lindanitolerans]|uniref:2TM domain-containing protein n=1 Tax=Flavobacterium lindanitolerans TaxID=428988 RepID=UPI001A38AD8E|nr:2TM domain-containing protein [Flavobacterium lindanitolerans]MBL7868823.1 2TM domain-containing protein [Flavobacterium lindanitolerans]
MENLTEQEQRRLERAQKRVKSILGFYKHLIAYVLVNLFLISRHYFDLKPGEEFFKFSTFSVAFFWGFGLAVHAASVFGKNIFLGGDWEERKINEIIKREKASKWE